VRRPTKFCLHTLKHRDSSEDLGVEWNIMLPRILNKQDVRLWMGFVSIRIMTGAGLLKTR
jgi:hypothetical protein